MGIDELPNEILKKIICMLPSKDVRSLSQCCRRSYTFCLPTLWSTPRFSNYLDHTRAATG